MITNLIYDENENYKVFKSPEFNYFFDKKTFLSVSFGKNRLDDVIYNPLSPEKIDIILSEKYVFDENILNKIFDLKINLNKDDKLNYLISCISNVNVHITKFACDSEIRKLFEFLNKMGVAIFYNLDYTNKISMRDVYKFKFLNVNKLNLNVNNYLTNLVDIIKLFVENNIFVTINLNLNKDNINDAFKLFEKDNIGNFLNISIKIDKSLNKKDLQMISNNMKGENVIFERNFYNRYKKYDDIIFNDYTPGLYSCVIDFNLNRIYPSLEVSKNFVNITDVNNISDYWYSDVFEKFRQPLVKKLEKIKLNNLKGNTE